MRNSCRKEDPEFARNGDKIVKLAAETFDLFLKMRSFNGVDLDFRTVRSPIDYRTLFRATLIDDSRKKS